MLLQRVLFPSKEICTCDELYYHRTGNEIAFDGFFNLFDMHKWKKYTIVRDIRLCISWRGECRIRIYTESGEADFAKEYLKKSLKDGGGQEPEFECTIQLPENDDERYYWFSVEMLSKDAGIVRAVYESADAPSHDIHLAANICTYRREAYVRRNVRLLQSQLIDRDTSPLHGKLDVYVIDNGQTLEDDFSSSSVHLFKNKNTGGTGGFTRGILEINRERKLTGATHVIMLDDDALIEPEAFVRTWALLSYIRKEYVSAG